MDYDINKIFDEAMHEFSDSEKQETYEILEMMIYSCAASIRRNNVVCGPGDLINSIQEDKRRELLDKALRLKEDMYPNG